MKNRFLLIYRIKWGVPILLLMIGIFSCTNQNLGLLENKISNQLSAWNLNNEVSIEEQGKTLQIDIFYKDNDTIDDLYTFFLDDESKNMVTSMLTHVFYDDLKGYEIVYFQLMSQLSAPQTDNIELTKEEIHSNHVNFSKVPTFVHFVEYALTNMRYMGVLKATQAIKYFNKNTYAINFDGSFWDFLYLYSLSCNSQKMDKEIVKQFLFFVTVVNDPEFLEESDDYFPEPLFYFVEYCGYSKEELNSAIKSYRLIDYLNEELGITPKE